MCRTLMKIECARCATGISCPMLDADIPSRSARASQSSKRIDSCRHRSRSCERTEVLLSRSCSRRSQCVATVPRTSCKIANRVSTSQCAGTSPSHSMPEGFMAARGFKPLVTAWEMTAWRFSFSSSISRCCSATNASIFAVSRSRNAAMRLCSVEWRKRNWNVLQFFQLQDVRMSPLHNIQCRPCRERHMPVDTKRMHYRVDRRASHSVKHDEHRDSFGIVCTNAMNVRHSATFGD